jgi:hypothetical protein
MDHGVRHRFWVGPHRAGRRNRRRDSARERAPAGFRPLLANQPFVSVKDKRVQGFHQTSQSIIVSR